MSAVSVYATYATYVTRPLAPIKGEGELSSRFADFEAPPSFWDTSPVRRETEGALGVGVGGRTRKSTNLATPFNARWFQLMNIASPNEKKR